MSDRKTNSERRPARETSGSAALVVRPESRIDFKLAAQQVIAAKKSPHTRSAYTRDLDGWLQFCGHERIDPKMPSLSDATRYRDALIGSEDTKRRRLASMSTIYSTMRKLPDEHGRPIVASNPFHPEILAWPRAGKVLKSRRITDDQAFAIVQAASGSARDHALLCLLRDTGWRRTAVVSLPRANYDGRRVYNRQKGDKEQEVELPDEHGRPIVASNPFHPEILAWPRAGKVLKSRRITDDQAFAIVQAASGSARDHALLCLLRDTGWRRTAVVSLPRANYDGRRVYNRQKGDKEQEVELPDDSVAAIERWLRERRTSDYLFPADDADGHMHPNTVNKIIDRWAKEIAPEAHPHSFRALFLRDAHDAGLPAYEIQGAAGHASSDMTARYDGKARGTGVARQVAQFRARRRGDR